MKKNIIMALLLLISVTAFAQNNVKFIPADSVFVSEEITITYDNKNTVLEGKKEIEGVVYYFADYKWIADDLNLTKVDTGWVAKYRVPKDAALITVIYNSGELKDKGGIATYTTFTRDRKMQNIPSSYIGWGMLRNPHMSQIIGIDGLCDSINKIENNVMLFWLNQEIRFFPQSREHLFHLAMEILKSTDYPKINSDLVSEINALLSLENVSEKPLMEAKKLSVSILNDKELESRIEARIKEKFPCGIANRDELIRVAFREADIVKKETMMDEILKLYPSKIYRDVSTDLSDLYYGKLVRAIVYDAIMKKNDYSKVDKYLYDTPLDALATYYWHIIQIPYRDKSIPLDKAFDISTKLVNELQSRPRPESQLQLSPKNYQKYFDQRMKEVFHVHAKILNEKGELAEALTYLVRVAPYAGYENSDFNDSYAKILYSNNKKKEAIAHIIKAIEANAVTVDMMNLLKKNYKGTDFDAYVSELKTPALSQMKHELEADIINKDIELFSFKAMNGGEVDMKKLKGKIIVIDLWASWCAPCKAALPAMQVAVNKYKNDPNVKFYFLATMENDANFREKLKKFIKEKSFSDLVVIYDNLNGEGQYQQAYDVYAKAFGLHGIPHKLIIDGNGKLRWSSSGYNGNPSLLVDEISYIIEKIKKEDK